MKLNPFFIDNKAKEHEIDVVLINALSPFSPKNSSSIIPRRVCLYELFELN